MNGVARRFAVGGHEIPARPAAVITLGSVRFRTAACVVHAGAFPIQFASPAALPAFNPDLFHCGLVLLQSVFLLVANVSRGHFRKAVDSFAVDAQWLQNRRAGIAPLRQDIT